MLRLGWVSHRVFLDVHSPRRKGRQGAQVVFITGQLERVDLTPRNCLRLPRGIAACTRSCSPFAMDASSWAPWGRRPVATTAPTENLGASRPGDGNAPRTDARGTKLFKNPARSFRPRSITGTTD